MKERLVIVGAGLAGSVLAMRLRDRFDVTVVEQSARKRPLLDDITCAGGAVTATINRAAGLGGTTSYWHNALIELDADDLTHCGLDPAEFAEHYARAWQLFLTPEELRRTSTIGGDNDAERPRRGALAHMVVPYHRVNAWQLASRAMPGAPVRIVYGHAGRIVPAAAASEGFVELAGANGSERIVGDRFIVAAGGLATPQLLAASRGIDDATFGGYHDHPMTYVAKVRLRPDSRLKAISCRELPGMSVRAGFVYRSRGLKAVFYLRPARSLALRSIVGDARYVLSDLRNDPFSPTKIWQLFTNIEALREGILFKTGAGFIGDYYSVLMLGEQEGRDDRGIRVRPGERPALDWFVSDAEHAAYAECLEQFLADIGSDIVASNIVPPATWNYRTGAHHSGSARDFLDAGATGLDFFAARDLQGVLVCDGSVLRAGGVANSGLTLVALCERLASALEHAS